MEPLRIAVPFHLPFYAPVWVAQRLGTFRDEGLDVTVTLGPNDILMRGEVGIALAGVMRSLVLADQPDPVHLIAIAEVNSRDGFFVLSRDAPDGFRWGDLIGKKLALFSLAPTPWMCLQGVLRRDGVDPGQVHIVEGLGVDEGIDALRNGDVDYLQTSQPMVEELIASSAAYLAAAQARDVGHVPYSSFIVTNEFRRSRPDLCGRAVRALAQTLEWMAQQRGDQIADLIAPEFPDIRPAILRKIIVGYQEAGTWAEGPFQQRQPFERLASNLTSGGLIRTAAPYDLLVDNTFAEPRTS